MSMGRGRWLVAGLASVLSAVAVGTVALESQSLAVAEASPGCALVNDPDNGLDGVQSSFQEIGPTQFGDGERILITVDAPTSGGVAGIRVLLGDTPNIDWVVTSLPATFEVWGLGSEMRWETMADTGVDGDVTVTWQTECIPAPIIAATAECREDDGVIVVSIADRVASAYEIFVGAGPPDPVMSVAGETAVFEYTGLSSGVNTVVVEPVADRRIELIITDVEVSCGEAAAATTTTVPPIVTQPTITATTGAVDVGATLPETGGSTTVRNRSILLGLGLVAGGFLLLVIRRRPA